MAFTIRPLTVPQANPTTHSDTSNKWSRRRDIPLAILAWLVLIAILLWAASHIATTILLFILASLLAYALAPGVRFAARFMPRFLAILLVYVVVLGILGVLLYYIIRISIEQISSLVGYVSYLLTPGQGGQAAPLQHMLAVFGISAAQINTFRAQVIAQGEGLVTSAVPIVTGVFSIGLDIIVVSVLSIYLLVDGARIGRWIRNNAPRPARADFVVDTFQRVVGGYIRGQVILCGLIGVLVGLATALLHVPYALLLGVLAFFLEFIPILGTIISGAISILLGLTVGWPTAIGVLIAFIVIHMIEGELVGPRIVGKAIGLHPAISLVAVIAGSELFGLWGALLASPIVGVLQVVVITLWKEWRTTYPEQFKAAADTITSEAEKSLTQTDEHHADN